MKREDYMAIVKDIHGNDVALREGDLFAWNTPKGVISTGIRIVTSGFNFSKGINHVAPLGFSTKDLENDELELKALSAEKEGVRYRYIVEMIKEAEKDGSTLFHLPLMEWVRELFDFGRYQAMGDELDGKPYGYLQHFVAVAIDEGHVNWLSSFGFVKGWMLKAMRTAFYNDPETIRKAVCSSVTAWEYIEALREHLAQYRNQLNPNEQTPVDTTSWMIYRNINVLAGKNKDIHRFGTEDIMNGVITGV